MSLNMFTARRYVSKAFHAQNDAQRERIEETIRLKEKWSLSKVNTMSVPKALSS